MKINRILLFFAWFFFINQPSYFTQVLSNTVSGGGVANGTNGIITYSIGQVADISATGPNGIFLEGVQQPFEISIITGIEVLNINLSVYPNPTQDFLTLSIKDIDLSTLGFKLYDANGKLLSSQRVFETSSNIYLGEYANGAYYLKVMDNLKELKNFKIILTQ